MSWEEARERWEALDARYVELEPNSGWLEMGDGFEYERAFEWELAADAYSRALAKELTESELLRGAGRHALLLGRNDLSVRIFELALAIDPLNHQVRRLLSQALMFRGGPGDYDRAIRIREEYLAKASGGRPFYSMLLLLTGRAEEIPTIWADFIDEHFIEVAPYLAMAEFDMGNADAALATLARLEKMLVEEPELSPRTRSHIRFNLASAHAWMGDADKAFAQLLPPSEHVSYTDRLDVFNPVWRKITDDPRWTEYREAIGMSQERLDAIEFDPWLPE